MAVNPFTSNHTERNPNMSTMTGRDASRLVAELTKITVHPELHNQVVWTLAEKDPTKFPESECGTVGCLAGNAVITAGYPLLWSEQEHYDRTTGRYELKWKASTCLVADEERQIERVAQDLFGLTREQARQLFDPDNSLGELWSKAIEFADGWIGVDDVVNAFKQREARVKADAKAALLKAVEKL